MRLLLALLLLCSVASSFSRGVSNPCEEACKSDLKPICVEHYDTNCKPSWWGVPEAYGGSCMSLQGVPRRRRVFPNRCKYECIKAQFCWEAWEEVADTRVKLSRWCKQQWKKFGFAAAAECQKC